MRSAAGLIRRAAVVVGLGALLVTGCDVELDDEPEPEPTPEAAADPEPEPEPTPEPTPGEPSPEPAEAEGDPVDADAVLAMLDEFSEQYNGGDYVSASAHVTSDVERDCGGATALT